MNNLLVCPVFDHLEFRLANRLLILHLLRLLFPLGLLRILPPVCQLQFRVEGLRMFHLEFLLVSRHVHLRFDQLESHLIVRPVILRLCLHRDLPMPQLLFRQGCQRVSQLPSRLYNRQANLLESQQDNLANSQVEVQVRTRVDNLPTSRRLNPVPCLVDLRLAFLAPNQVLNLQYLQVGYRRHCRL